MPQSECSKVKSNCIISLNDMHNMNALWGGRMCSQASAPKIRN